MAAKDVQTVDYAFECDAPTFVDFAKLKRGELEEEDIDSWFDTHRDEEGGVFIVDEDGDEVIHLNEEEAMDLIVEEVDPEEREEEEAMSVSEEEQAEEIAPKSEPSCNPFEDDFATVSVADSGSQVKEPPTTATEVPGTSSGPVPMNAGTEVLLAWKQLMSKKAQPQSNSVVNKPSTTQPKTFSHGAPARSYATKITFPETPEVYRRLQKRPVDHSKNSEDIEMEVIAKKRKEAIHVLQMSKASFARLRSTRAPDKVRKVKPAATTKVQEFKFHSHKGEKKCPSDTGNANASRFPMTLRNSSNSSVKHPLKKDVKPFNVATVAAKKGDGENYVSVAQAVANFHKKTPPRFKSITAKEQATGPSRGEGGKHITHPQSPNLHTKLRSRQTAVQSTAEKETHELAQKVQFKAQPLNPKILQPGYHGLYGVVKEELRVPTRPVAPKLATAEREAKRKQMEKTQEQPGFVFKAQDLPKGMLEGVKGLPEKRTIPVTVPQSPAFEAKRRRLMAEHEADAGATDSDEASSEASSSILSQPEKAVFRPHLEHKHTEPQPFPFEQRYQGKVRRQELVQKELVKEQQELAQKRKFQAQAVPDFQPPPDRPAPVATQVQPFNLLTDVRGAKYQEEFEEKVKQELEDSRRKAEFKATENSTIYSRPFIPNFEFTRKPLGEVPTFRLNTEVRAEQRAAYEETKRLREEEQERVLAIEMEELEREEQRQLMEHRKRLVHQAQPVRQFKPLEIKKSDKSLTAPVAPHLATSERLHRQQD